MLLKLTYKNQTEQILNLSEPEWQFHVRIGSKSDVDNSLVIHNSTYNINTDEEILNFFNLIKPVSPEDVENIQVYYESTQDNLLFDLTSLNLNYANAFLDYHYNSNMTQVGMMDRGLSIGFILRSFSKDIYNLEENNLETEE